MTVQVGTRITNVDGLVLHSRFTFPVPPGAPVVVLLHGLSVSSRYMMRLARELGSDFRVLAPDLPGIGLSDSARRPLDVPGLARALGAWLDASGVEHAFFLGNSAGCQTIAELAVHRPGLVERAVLQGPTTDRHARNVAIQVLRWLLCGFLEPLALFPVLLRDYLDSSFRRTKFTVSAMLADRIETKLPRLDMPVLVVRGKWDPIVPQAWAEEVTRLLPRGRLVVIPGAAHAVNFSRPTELARIVRSFLLEPVAQEATVR
jgi:pimeloyl-ACP methyl ester carboxylesterase